MELLGEKDDTFNGLIYRLRHAESGEERNYITVKCALDAFLADHKEPWVLYEVDPNGTVCIEGELQDMRCWYGGGFFMGMFEFMQHYGYAWVADQDTTLYPSARFRDIRDPGRFEKRKVDDSTS